MNLPIRVVERLIAYRRHLRWWLADGRTRIYSHELAAMDGVTPAVVRRDLMTIGYTGSPARGYDAAGLIEWIGKLLDCPRTEGVVLVGLGSLGRAILNYFTGIHPELPIVAAFDIAPDKVGRVVDGCRCHHPSEMEAVLREQPVTVGIIALPMDASQDAADHLIRCGVRGILNFTPVRLRVPPEAYVEDVDIAVSLEKVAFYARTQANRLEARA